MSARAATRRVSSIDASTRPEATVAIGQIAEFTSHI